jgi:hypothetical protein
MAAERSVDAGEASAMSGSECELSLSIHATGLMIEPSV